MELDIKLKRANKVYHEGETIVGLIIIDSKSESDSSSELLLMLDATVEMKLSSKSFGIFEAFERSAKPINLVNQCVRVTNDRFAIGKTEIPFEIVLDPKRNRTLYETYHGVFINITYLLRTELRIRKSILNRDIQKVIEIIIEYPKPESWTQPKIPLIPLRCLMDQSSKNKAPFQFSLSPDSLQNVKDKSKVPRFRIIGSIDTLCYIWEPLSGQIKIESCEQPIRSVEIQLVRVETLGCEQGYAIERTEIQNNQIADGNILRGTTLQVWIPFPRLFCCCSVQAINFKIQFEVKIVIILEGDFVASCSIPIQLIRYSVDELLRR